MTTIPFEHLPKPERARLVRALMAEGGSNRSVARALGTTIGAVARTRHDFAIPSMHPPFFAWRHAPDAPPTVARMEELAKQPVEPPEELPEPPGKPRPPYKLASSPKSACIEPVEGPDGRLKQCSFEAQDGPYCKLHAWMHTHNLK